MLVNLLSSLVAGSYSYLSLLGSVFEGHRSDLKNGRPVRVFTFNFFYIKQSISENNR